MSKPTKEPVASLHSGGTETRPLRVAFLSSRLDLNDGVASHIELLASHLVRRGTHLTMITGLITGSDIARERNATLHRLFPRWHQIQDVPLRPRLGTIRRLAAVLRDAQLDVLHVHGVKALTLARLATIGSKIPIVTTYHPSAHGKTAADFQVNVTAKQRLLYRLFLEILRPDCLIALSSDTYELFVTRVGWLASRVRKIICGVDTDHFRAPSEHERARARSVLGMDADAITFVLPGRLNLNKGHDIVVSAFEELQVTDPSLKLLCLFPGAGAQEREIRSMIQASTNPDMFRMLGFVPNMRDVYWAADAALLPSRNEGFAIVVAEAMVCGCPTIRTPSGGCTDQIVEGETGYTVDFNNARDLAENIRRMTRGVTMSQMRRHVTVYARVKFSVHRMAEETMALYHSYLR